MPLSRFAVVVLPCALLLSACGTKSVSKDTVESQIKSGLGGQAPAKIKAVKCPGDLDAKVGKSETCTITLVTGARYAVRAKVKTVDGGNATFDAEVTKQLP